MRYARFAPTSLLAVAPQAFGLDFVIALGPREDFYEAAEGVACVEICGPLMHGPSLFENYGSIRRRVASALAEHPVVILKIDSPGGEVAGAFDCARSIAADAKALGRRVIAFTEAQCCSAAYALACAADEIVATDTAAVGSVGVLQMRPDVTRQNDMLGVSIALITSGRRKADTNPIYPLTEDAVGAIQRQVDDQAAVFFGWVDSRRSIDSAALQAGTFIGESAKTAGLIDAVESWDALVARALSPPTGSILDSTSQEVNMPAPQDPKSTVAASASVAKEGDSDSLYKMLKAEAESEDPVRSKAAKKALAAYESDDDGDKEDKKESKAEDKKEDPEAKALTSAATSLASELAARDARIAALEAENAARAVAQAAAEKTAFLASRPDLPEAVVTACKDLSFEKTKEIVNGIPVGFDNPFARRPAASVAGQPQRRTEGFVSEEASLAMDRAFAQAGELDYSGVKLDGVVQTFGAPVRKEQS